MRTIALFISAAVITAAVPITMYAQSAPSPSDRSKRAIDAFLAREEAQQRKRAERVAAAGQPEIIGQVRALIASAGLPPPKAAGASDVQLGRLRTSFETEVAQKLVEFGFNPGDIKRQPSVVQAAGRYTRGQHTLADLALLVDLVVIGTVQAVTDEALGDPFRSTVRLTDLRSLKGDAAPSAVLVRQESGKGMNGHWHRVSGDLQKPGTRYALFLSSSYYNHLAGRVPRQIGRPASRPSSAEAKYVPIGAWYVVLPGDKLLAAEPGMPRAESVQQLSAAIQ